MLCPPQFTSSPALGVHLSPRAARSRSLRGALSSPGLRGAVLPGPVLCDLVAPGGQPPPPPAVSPQ